MDAVILRENIARNSKKLASHMGKKFLYFHEGSDYSEFCRECKQLLEVSENEISDNFILELFDDLQMTILNELPTDVKENILFVNHKAYCERSMKNQEKLLNKADQTVNFLNNIDNKLGNLGEVKIYVIPTSVVGIKDIDVSFSKKMIVEDIEDLGNPTHTMQLPYIGNNNFYYMLDRLKNVAEKRKYLDLIGRDKLIKDIKNWLGIDNKGNLTYCSLIGPGGAGKTHIGLEISKRKICGFQPYYFEKDNFSELNKVLKKHREDVIIRENTLFILDYVYEQIDVIKELLDVIKKTECKHRVAIMFIERDSTMEYFRNVLPNSKKFFVNTHLTGEEAEVYWLSDEALKAIMYQILPTNVKEKEGHDKLAQTIAKCVSCLNTHIDKIFRRPIFMVFFAEMYRDACLNDALFEIDVVNMDMLLEKYWMWKIDYQLRDICGEQWEGSELVNIKLSCEEFSKVLLVCASVLGHNILLVRKTDDRLPFEVVIEKALQGQKKYLVPLIEEYMKKIPKNFIESDGFIKYMEKLCKTQLLIPVGLNRDTIIIRPEKDIVSEWLIYREIVNNERYGLKESWLRKLVPVLREYAMHGYVALTYRGAIDFPQIAEILMWIEKEPDFDKLVNYSAYLLTGLVKKEIGGQSISQEEIEVVIKVFEILGSHDDYTNADFDIKQNIEKQVMLSVGIDGENFYSMRCYEIFSNLPEKLEIGTLIHK